MLSIYDNLSHHYKIADEVGNGQIMLKGHINYFKTFYRDTDIPSYRLA